MSKHTQTAPKQDNEGYGLAAGVGKDKDWTATDQDGENCLLKESDFNDRAKMLLNE